MITIKVESSKCFSATNEFNERVDFNDGIFQSFLEGDRSPIVAETKLSIKEAFSETLFLLGA